MSATPATGITETQASRSVHDIIDSGLDHIHPALGVFGADTIVVDRAEGIYLYDTSGKRLLDVMSGYWMACFGYGESGLVRIVAEASKRLSCWHLFTTAHTSATRYTDQMMNALPERLRGKLLFANTGSAAMEIALRVACAIVANRGSNAVFGHFDRSYHGSTFLSQQMSPDRWNDWPTSLRLRPNQKVQFAHPISDQDAERALTEIRGAVTRREGPNILLSEPMPGVGGMIPPPDWFFPELRQICDAYGVVWISDEISTGFGPTGKLFAFEHDGAIPDIVVLGKRMAAGYFPMAGVIVSAQLADDLLGEEFHHGYSTSGHPVGCEVASEVLNRVTEPALLKRINDTGHQLEGNLKIVAEQYPQVGGVYGRGMMRSMEMPNARIAEIVAKDLAKEGIFEMPEGKYLTLCPPFVIETDQILELRFALERVFARVF